MLIQIIEHRPLVGYPDKVRILDMDKLDLQNQDEKEVFDKLMNAIREGKDIMHGRNRNYYSKVVDASAAVVCSERQLQGREVQACVSVYVYHSNEPDIVIDEKDDAVKS